MDIKPETYFFLSKTKTRETNNSFLEDDIEKKSYLKNSLTNLHENTSYMAVGSFFENNHNLECLEGRFDWPISDMRVCYKHVLVLGYCDNVYPGHSKFYGNAVYM